MSVPKREEEVKPKRTMEEVIVTAFNDWGKNYEVTCKWKPWTEKTIRQMENVLAAALKAAGYIHVSEATKYTMTCETCLGKGTIEHAPEYALPDEGCLDCEGYGVVLRPEYRDGKGDHEKGGKS